MTDVLKQLRDMVCDCNDDFVCVRCESIKEIKQLRRLKTKSKTKVTKPSEAEMVYWESIKNSKDIDSYKSYLELFSCGLFSSLATKRLNRISEENRNSSSPGGLFKNAHQRRRSVPPESLPVFDYETLNKCAIRNTKEKDQADNGR